MNPPRNHPHQHHLQHYTAPSHHSNLHVPHGVPPAAGPAGPQQGFSRKRSVSGDSEDQTWHSFKRLRLQTSDESSYHSSSGDDSVYNNRHDTNNGTFAPGGHPSSIAYQHTQQQHPGQTTASSESFQQDYAKVNHFLGLLHQQRRHRVQTEGATSTSEGWARQHHQGSMQSSMPQQNPRQHTPYNPHGGPPKQQRRHVVTLPSNSNLM